MGPRPRQRFDAVQTGPPSFLLLKRFALAVGGVLQLDIQVVGPVRELQMIVDDRLKFVPESVGIFVAESDEPRVEDGAKMVADDAGIVVANVLKEVVEGLDRQDQLRVDLSVDRPGPPSVPFVAPVEAGRRGVMDVPNGLEKRRIEPPGKALGVGPFPRLLRRLGTARGIGRRGE